MSPLELTFHSVYMLYRRPYQISTISNTCSRGTSPPATADQDNAFRWENNHLSQLMHSLLFMAQTSLSGHLTEQSTGAGNDRPNNYLYIFALK